MGCCWSGLDKSKNPGGDGLIILLLTGFQLKLDAANLLKCHNIWLTDSKVIYNRWFMWECAQYHSLLHPLLDLYQINLPILSVRGTLTAKWFVNMDWHTVIQLYPYSQLFC